MSKRLLYTALILTLLVLTACTAAAPGAKPAAAETKTVRIGTQPWIGYGPWWIAQEKGLFAKHGLEAKLIDFVQDTEVNAAFASGEMDVANLATHTAIKLFANGVDLRAVLMEDASNQADAIIAAQGITDVAALKGKKVAYEEGSTSDLLLNYALQKNGMTLKDISPAPMPAADAGSALIAGKVDAAVTYEPYIAAAKAANSAVKSIYTAAEDPGLISDVLAARTKFAAENPATMQALLQVWDEAVQFLKDHPDEGRAIIAKAVQSSPAELASAFDGVRIYSLAENQKSMADGSMLAAMQDVLTTAQGIGIVKETPDLSKLLAPAAAK